MSVPSAPFIFFCKHLSLKKKSKATKEKCAGCVVVSILTRISPRQLLDLLTQQIPYTPLSGPYRAHYTGSLVTMHRKRPMSYWRDLCSGEPSSVGLVSSDPALGAHHTEFPTDQICKVDFAVQTTATMSVVDASQSAILPNDNRSQQCKHATSTKTNIGRHGAPFGTAHSLHRSACLQLVGGS